MGSQNLEAKNFWDCCVQKRNLFFFWGGKKQKLKSKVHMGSWAKVKDLPLQLSPHGERTIAELLGLFFFFC